MMKKSRAPFLVVLTLTFSGQFCKRSHQSQSIGSAINPPTSLFTDASSSIPDSVRNDMCMDAQAYDIDNDGDLDIILAIEFGTNHLLINNGQGIFSLDSGFPKSHRDSEDIAVNDFNQDGNPDIFIASEDDLINETYISIKAGKFERVEDNMTDHGVSNGVASHDFDSKLGPDLVLANRGENFLLINNGAGSFQKVFLNGDTSTSQDLEIGDLDNDGDMDIVIANEGRNQILINQGNLNFVDETENRNPKGFPLTETRDIDLIDIDGDGDLDIFSGNVALFKNYSPQNRIYINNGRGIFSDETSSRLPLDDLSTFDGDFYDFDGDGDVDLVTANGNLWSDNGRTYAFYENTGGGHFSLVNGTRVPTIQDVDGFDVEIADFNGDGINDIYFCSRGRKTGGSTDYLFFGKPSLPHSTTH